MTGAASLASVEVSGNTASGAGGGIALMCWATAQLTDVEVSANDAGADGVGGGLFAWVSTVDLVRTRLRDNNAKLGGGIAAVVSTIAGGDVVANHAEDGGGISLDGSTLTGAVVSGNEALGTGGGVAAYARYKLPVVLSDARLEGNTAKWGGGVAIVYDAGLSPWCSDPDADLCSARLEAVTIAANAAEYGGGIYNTLGELSFAGGAVTENVADDGGGLYSLWWGDPWVYLYDPSFHYADAAFADSVVARNQATRGGGAFLFAHAPLASEASDWGEGVDDNVGDDVWIDYSELSYAGYGADTTFECFVECSPEP